VSGVRTKRLGDAEIEHLEPAGYTTPMPPCRPEVSRPSMTRSAKSASRTAVDDTAAFSAVRYPYVRSVTSLILNTPGLHAFFRRKPL